MAGTIRPRLRYVSREAANGGWEAVNGGARAKSRQDDRPDASDVAEMTVVGEDARSGRRRACGDPDVVDGERRAGLPKRDHDLGVQTRNARINAHFFHSRVGQELAQLAFVLTRSAAPQESRPELPEHDRRDSDPFSRVDQ